MSVVERGTILERAHVVDVLTRDEESLVLLESRCLMLTPVAARVMELLDTPRPAEQIHRVLEAEFGSAPFAQAAKIIAELIAVGGVRVKTQPFG